MSRGRAENGTGQYGGNKRAVDGTAETACIWPRALAESAVGGMAESAVGGMAESAVGGTVGGMAESAVGGMAERVGVANQRSGMAEPGKSCSRTRSRATMSPLPTCSRMYMNIAAES